MYIVICYIIISVIANYGSHFCGTIECSLNMNFVQIYVSSKNEKKNRIIHYCLSKRILPSSCLRSMNFYCKKLINWFFSTVKKKIRHTHQAQRTLEKEPLFIDNKNKIRL